MSGKCEACGNPYSIGDWPFCPHGKPHGGLGITSIHPSERAVVYRNPRTGEIRTPARNDQPMPATYARQGYERHELTSAREIKALERQGHIHESSNYDEGSGHAEREVIGDSDKPLDMKLDIKALLGRD